MKKYKKENILDMSRKAGPRVRADLADALFRDMPFRPIFIDAFEYEVETVDDKTIDVPILTEEVLIKTGRIIFENLAKQDIVLVNLSMPSDNIYTGKHAVALGIDKKSGKIYYNNSFGIDMRGDLKDFLAESLPGYSWEFSKEVQQDVSRDDNSCSYLALYNLRDMLYKMSGQHSKVKNFGSVSARQDAWDNLKDIDIESMENKIG